MTCKWIFIFFIFLAAISSATIFARTSTYESYSYDATVCALQKNYIPEALSLVSSEYCLL